MKTKKCFVTLLKRARKTIIKSYAESREPPVYRRKRSPYICDNIHWAAKTKSEKEHAEALCNYIEKRLNYGFSLAHWLFNAGHMTYEEFRDRNDQRVYDKLQVTRLAWIDHLIEVLS